MNFKSISMRIFIFVIPTIVVTIISFAFLSFYISNSRINQTINEKMYESLYAADLEIQLELYKNAVIAKDFAKYAKTLDIKTFNQQDNKKYLADSILSNPNTFGGGICFEPYAIDSESYYFGPFLYRSEAGETVYVPNYGEYIDYFNMDWYIKGVYSAGELLWSKVYYDPVSNQTLVTASKPFYNDAGRFIGVGTADMNLVNIQHIVNNISIGETGDAFIIGSNGEYISFFDDGKSINELMWEDSDAELAKLGNELINKSTGTTSFVRNGKALRVYYMTMAHVNWTLAITVEESEINASAMDSFIVTVIVPVIGLLFVLLGIYVVTRYIRKIVNKVNSFADMAASGDFSKRIDVTETDEFGFMEQRLNVMISNMNDMSRTSAELLTMAENASTSKSEFLSRMSHEIRTPMNAIIGMTQIAKSSGDETRVKDCLDKIDTASKHLLALINDILDMSKIEANKLELDEEEFNLEQTLTDIYSMMIVKSEEKNQLLELNIDKSTPKYIIGDKLRFSQVVTNLVGNALKFTPESGSISIDISELERDEDKTLIKVSVRDNGIGLSEEQQEKLFKSFEQVDGSISRKYGGTGLGLAISKRIVEIMGGEIWVTSEPGKGSIFSFTVKARIGEGNINTLTIQTEYQNNEDIKSLRFLIADDSQEANEYMKHVLNSLGFSCDNVYNGSEALEAIKKSEEQNRPYDFVFMDYIMPQLNGIETAKKIKQISNNSTAVIMVSIYDWKDIEQEAGEAGVVKHITKPFSPSCVLDVINEVLYGTRKGGVSTSLSPSGFDGNTILVAEDIDINREIVESLLEDLNINIDFAENGIQAVEMFKAAPDKYDLILMDIQMPQMDGYEATRRIRHLDIKRSKTIPIIAMTANALSDDVKKCKEAGMNDHLAKPIEPEILIFKLNDYFFMKEYLNNNIW